MGGSQSQCLSAWAQQPAGHSLALCLQASATPLQSSVSPFIKWGHGSNDTRLSGHGTGLIGCWQLRGSTQSGWGRLSYYLGEEHGRQRAQLAQQPFWKAGNLLHLPSPHSLLPEPESEKSRPGDDTQGVLELGQTVAGEPIMCISS